jgi:hypothetical protein
MAIKLYPNRVFRSLPTPVDAVMQKDTVKQVKGVQDITATPISEVITPNRDWKVVGIKFSFSSGTGRDYSASVIGGRSVLENLNDFLFFQVERTLPVKITLDPGFYTGTQLATELQTQMNAATAFSDLGITFTVAYSATDGEFTITPSSGNIKYLEENPFGALPDQYSIAGHLFGFNVNTAFAASITSDTVVAGLDAESAIIDVSGGTDLSHYNSDIHYLSLDEAIKIVTNTAGVTVDYSVDYQEVLT